MALDWVQNIGQDPVMQKFLQLMKSDPQAAAKIDARAQELVEGELSDSMYVDYSKRTNALDGRREFPMQTALKMAMEEFAQSGQGSTPLAGVPSFAPGQDPRDAQARLTGDGNSTLPSFAPGQGVQTGTGQFGGVPPVLDQLAGREAEDDLRGVTLSPLDQQGSPADAGLMFPLGKDMDIVGNRSQLLSQDRAQFPAGSPQNYRDVQEGNVGSSFDVSMLKDILTQKEAAQEQGETPFIDVPGPSNDPGSYFLKGKEPDILTQIEAGEQGAMIPQGKPVDILTKAQMGEGDGGFDLSKLLGALGSNTGLTALGIGAQGLGGVLQGRAQNKANKAASKQQRTNNAIAAFTGGNAQQAQAKSTSSTGGNILSALGQTLGGVAQGRRAQESIDQAQSNADRQFGLDERELGQVDARTAALTEVERIRAAAAGGKGNKAEEEAAELQGQFEIMNKTLTELQDVHGEGEFFTTGSLAFFEMPSGLGGDRQAYLEALGNSLMGPLNSVHQLGRLSDKDIEILRKSIPTWDDGGPTVTAKVAAVRKLIEFSKTNSNKSDAPAHIISALTGGFGGSTTKALPIATGGGMADMSEDELQRIVAGG